MDLEEKRKVIENTQKTIDSFPYASTFPYPYCCVCFERLTEHNILEDDDGDCLINVCIACKDK
jgi:hypothetical protein